MEPGKQETTNPEFPSIRKQCGSRAVNEQTAQAMALACTIVVRRCKYRPAGDVRLKSDPDDHRVNKYRLDLHNEKKSGVSRHQTSQMPHGRALRVAQVYVLLKFCQLACAVK